MEGDYLVKKTACVSVTIPYHQSPRFLVNQDNVSDEEIVERFSTDQNKVYRIDIMRLDVFELPQHNAQQPRIRISLNELTCDLYTSGVSKKLTLERNSEYDFLTTKGISLSAAFQAVAAAITSKGQPFLSKRKKFDGIMYPNEETVIGIIYLDYADYLIQPLAVVQKGPQFTWRLLKSIIVFHDDVRSRYCVECHFQTKLLPQVIGEKVKFDELPFNDKPLTSNKKRRLEEEEDENDESDQELVAFFDPINAEPAMRR